MRGSAFNRSSLYKRCAAIPARCAACLKVKSHEMLGVLDASGAEWRGGLGADNAADVLSARVTFCQPRLARVVKMKKARDHSRALR
jgi:hypothetical protein